MSKIYPLSMAILLFLCIQLFSKIVEQNQQINTLKLEITQKTEPL